MLSHIYILAKRRKEVGWFIVLGTVVTLLAGGSYFLGLSEETITGFGIIGLTLVSVGFEPQKIITRSK